ncbi:uncharacterized protein LOC135122238 [Zophobas morio]|uniref:uncharacterized protein LOC135122238 n=1 Tax=Zophobas morio TaxID=2755281 RepID=UPI003083DD7D
MSSHNCQQLINDPTRVTPDSETLLDLIFVSSDLQVIESEVLDLMISEHNTVSCKIALENQKPKPLLKTIRSYKNFDIHKFAEDANKIDWSRFYQMSNIDEKLALFNHSLLMLFEFHAPLKTIKVKQHYQPWYTDNLKYLSKIKRKAWLRYKKSRSIVHKQFFCQVRNFYNLAVANEKRAYYQHVLSSVYNDQKKYWNKIKSLQIGNQYTNNTVPTEFNVNDINKHFIESVPKFSSCGEQQYISSFTMQSFSSDQFLFKPVDVATIETFVSNLKPNCAGVDCITGKMLQLASTWFSEPLTHIINLAFEQGQVPKLWNFSLVKPIPKKKTSVSLDDFRPISLICNTLKVAEFALCAQFKTFLMEKNILPSQQSGFRENFSTSTVLISLVDDIFSGFSSGKVTLLTLLDMSKAFDSLNISLLVTKLKYYGVYGATLNWFQNYLFNRAQLVD